MIKKLSKSGGFTLIEIIIVLAIIGMLAGILAPTLVKYVQSAKLRRATDDVKMIGTAIGNFYNDLGEWPVWVDGTAMTRADDVFAALVGPGDIPPRATGLTDWDTPLASEAADGYDLLADQLGMNVPGYTTTGREAWRGPYIEQFRADPWGNAYLVNVQYVQPAEEQNQRPVYVVSAGPDEEIDTNFTQTGPGMTVGGDDIVFRIK